MRLDSETFVGTIAASNLSGTNTGNVTLASVGSTPAAAGASLSAQVLTLQPADATNPGVVTTGTQTLAGAKTFSSVIASTVASGSNAVTMLPGAKLALGAFAESYLYAGDVVNGIVATGGSFSVGRSLSIRNDNAGAGLSIGSASNQFFGVDCSTGVVTAAARIDSTVASGSDAVKVLNGARLNLSTADANAYFYRPSANAIRTPADFYAGTVSAEGGLYLTNGVINCGSSGITVVATGRNTAGATAAPDVALRSIVTRTAGDLLQVQNLSTAVFTVDYTGKALAAGGIGVGNSAAATTLGTVVKKMEVFDAAGASLGFVPIYDAIT